MSEQSIPVDAAPQAFIGKRFGKLVVESPAPNANGFTWNCVCDCGTRKTIRSASLKSGHTKSCGCLSRRHGKTTTPEHAIWRGIKDRCLNKNTHIYKHYGGRGIMVCDRWLTFENFLADMGLRPTVAHSIDRIDNDGDYCPENCRWATRRQQCRNRTSNTFLVFNGQKKCLAEWAEEYGICRETIQGRLRKGWSVEEAITKPCETSNRKKMLTAEEVGSIRRRCLSGEAQRDVAADYHINQSQVSRIMHGKRCRHV